MALLSEDEITALLADHPQWRRRGGSLQRELEFKELAEAGRFVARASAHLPPRDPYPEFVLHGFKLVTVRIGHENSAGMSVADVRLIEELDTLIAAPEADESAAASVPPTESAPQPEGVLAAGVQGDPAPAADAPTDGGRPLRSAFADPSPPAPDPAPDPRAASPSLVARVISGAGLVATGVIIGRVLAWRAARRRRLRRIGLLG